MIVATLLRERLDIRVEIKIVSIIEIVSIAEPADDDALEDELDSIDEAIESPSQTK